jgi:integrase
MKKIRVPSCRLHKPTGQAVVTLSGKDFYLGRYDSSVARQRYAKLLAEWEATNRSPTFGEPVQSLTMAQVGLAYLEYAKCYHGAESREYYHCRRAIKPISELYANHLASKFGPAEFKACRQWWMSDTNRSRQYVNKMAKYLMAVIKWGVSEGLLPPSTHHACKCVAPLRAGKTDAPEAPKVTTVDDARVDAVIAKLSPIVADMIRFQRLTAARPGEICKLKPRMVVRSGDVWRIELIEHKTAYHGKTRTIFAGPKAQKLLAKYLLRDADSYCFSPAETVAWQRKQRSEARITPLSCGNRAGTNRVKAPKTRARDHYDTQTYAQAVRYACQQVYPAPQELSGLELKRWRKTNWFAPNQTRHNRATEIRAELGLEAASAALGHSSQQITLTYAEKNEQLAQKSARLSG